MNLRLLGAVLAGLLLNGQCVIGQTKPPEFCLAPILPPVEVEEFEILMSVHRDFESLRPSPKNQRLRGRVAAFGRSGFMDVSIWTSDDPQTFKSESKVVVCLLQRVDGKIAKTEFFEEPINEALAESLQAATEKVLTRTSYTSGSRAAVTGLDSEYLEVVAPFMAGMCYDPPANSMVGKMIETWLRMAFIQLGPKLVLPGEGEAVPGLDAAIKDLERAVTGKTDKTLRIEAHSILEQPPVFEGPDVSVDRYLDLWITSHQE